MTDLRVNEIFGPTLQGEGPSVGRRCGFVRLSGCNLDCSWCDTPYTWDWNGKNGVAYSQTDETRRMTVEAVTGAVEAMGVDMVVITGGEPVIQRSAVSDLVRRLDRYVEIETNGTLDPGKLLPLVRWNVSPKLVHSGVNRPLRPVLAQYATANSIFKFVCQHTADLDEIAIITDTYGIQNDRVWVMPEGRDPYTVNRRFAALADDVIARGWNLTTRLHIVAWGDTRGK